MFLSNPMVVPLEGLELDYAMARLLVDLVRLKGAEGV